MVDLTKDNELLEYHQADEILDQLILIQLHFERIYEGKFLGLCISCLDNKHIRAVRGLTSECITANCGHYDLWKSINEWANDILRNKMNTKYLGEKNPETKKLIDETRYYRKKVESIVSSFKNRYTGMHLSK